MDNHEWTIQRHIQIDTGNIGYTRYRQTVERI